MKDLKPKKLKKRIFASWITSLVSITLVLVMIGLLGLVLINARKLSDFVRERMSCTLVLDDELQEAEILRLQKILNTYEYVKSTRYIDKEEAGRELFEKLGEDFTEFLGYNPLFASIEVKLKAGYTNPDSLEILKEKFMSYPQIKDVYYQKNLIQVINRNARKIGFLILIISVLLTIIFIVLINNTIRISVYSQRFTINTMQMVGASNSFIRKPFLLRSLWLGIYGSFLANLIIFVVIFLYRKELQEIISLNDIYTIVFIFLLIFLMGLLFSILSSYFAVNKFLRMKFDEMFY